MRTSASSTWCLELLAELTNRKGWQVWPNVERWSFQYHSGSPYYQSQLGTNWWNSTQILNKIQSVNTERKPFKGCRSRNICFFFRPNCDFCCFHSRCWHIMATLSTFSFLFVFAESKGDLGWCTSVVYRAIWKQIKTWSEFAKAILCYANIWGDEITLKKKGFKALPEMPFLFMHRRKLFILKKHHNYNWLLIYSSPQRLCLFWYSWDG